LFEASGGDIQIVKMERQSRGATGSRDDVKQGRPLYAFRRGLEVNGVRYEKRNVSNSILENENGKEKAWLD
jgi:hypothetical protein